MPRAADTLSSVPIADCFAGISARAQGVPAIVLPVTGWQGNDGGQGGWNPQSFGPDPGTNKYGTDPYVNQYGSDPYSDPYAQADPYAQYQTPGYQTGGFPAQGYP